MGNDGGSIPGRKDLVKEKPKEIKIDQEIISKAQLKTTFLKI
jgi:Rtf2 RING-finger